MRNSVKDVFFDLDHTLWDFEKNSALAFAEVFRKNQIHTPLESFLEHYVPINTAYWARYRTGAITQTELRYGRLRDAFTLVKTDVSDEVIWQLADDYIRFLPQFNHLTYAARDILDYLAPQYRLHIITNGFSTIQSDKLKNANISQYFHTVTDSEAAGVKKPNKAIFDYALEKAGATCASSVMIGDCIEADVRGALDAGMRAILYHHEPHGDDAILQVTRLDQLKQYL